MEEKKFTLVGIIAALTLIAMLSLFKVMDLHDEINRKQKEIGYYESTYLYKTGGTSLWSGSNGKMIDYNLRSFDAGKTWYATHRTTNDEIIIDGPAETVYPGLLKTLQDWDNLVKYAEQNGPINPNNPADAKMLEQNGFTIKQISK